MSTKEELLAQFSEWIPFLGKMEGLDWNTPLGEGKWRIHDVVSHICYWDKYFFEEAIWPLTNDRPLTLKLPDFDEFNRRSVEIGRTQSKQELIDLSMHYRSSIRDAIKSQDPSDFTREYRDGDGRLFIVETFLKEFIHHDLHHRKQLEDKFLS